MDESRICQTCQIAKPVADFRDSRGKCWSIRCHECRKALRRRERPQAKQAVEASGPTIREHLETCRACRVCGKAKPLGAFPVVHQMSRGKRYHWIAGTCRVCEARQDRERLRSEQRKAWKREHRKIRPEPRDRAKNQARQYAWRKTPIGQYSRAITYLKRKIAASSDPIWIATWEARIMDCRQQLRRLRDEIDGQAKRAIS